MSTVVFGAAVLVGVCVGAYLRGFYEGWRGRR